MKITNLKDKLITAIIFFAVMVAFVAFKIPCPFAYFLNVQCPGCGMTRAYLSLLRLDFASAFRFHSMFWSVPILVLYYFTDWRLFGNKRLDNGVLIIIGVGFLVNWLVKLF